MSQATYMQDMFEEPADITAGPSEIASFYAGRNVLCTGGFGFLGRLLIEKLLRSCSEIQTLFLFLREKKGKSPTERFNELFNDEIFDRLKQENPGFSRKVVLIEGDMAQIGLGLSPERRELLRSTHIVVHGAATVRFDEKLRIASNINVRGTKELILLAKEMPNLKAFVHISTAYSNCQRTVIDEKCYQPPIDSDKLLDLLDILDDTAVDYLTPVLLGKWPNTYAFTKAIAEDVIRSNGQSLPVCIVRPSIVTATSREPVVGWINNVYGVTGVLVGVGFGILRTLHCNGETIADLIPADYVVNTVIAVAWDVAESRSTIKKCVDSTLDPEINVIPIYNSVSSCQRPITWHEVCEYNKNEVLTVPSEQCMWYFHFRMNRHRWIHNISIIFLHLLPAFIVDTVCRLIGRKPMLWKTYQKIHKFGSVLEYFTLQQWKFHANNVQQLANKLSLTDRSRFYMDISELHWEDYFHGQVRGIRLYIFKETLENLSRARARFAKLKILHYSVVTGAWGILFWLLLTFLRFIGIF